MESLYVVYMILYSYIKTYDYCTDTNLIFGFVIVILDCKL